jgi:aspartate dehydrogenase
MPAPSSRVALAGLGAIGSELARRLPEEVSGLELTAVAARDRDKARATLRSLGREGVAVVGVSELAEHADVVIECAPRQVLETLAESVLGAGKELIVLSAGALLDHPDWIELAERTGGRITVPTGALVGLDAVAAAALAGIDSLKITSRKPVAGLAGAPEIERLGVRLDELEEPLRVFAGTARDAARGFPANLNVTVALAMAGPGPDRTEVEVWADPHATHNSHQIELRSSVANLSLTIENVPSENPRTGRITALSVVSLLRKRSAALNVGS